MKTKNKDIICSPQYIKENEDEFIKIYSDINFGNHTQIKNSYSPSLIYDYESFLDYYSSEFKNHLKEDKIKIFGNYLININLFRINKRIDELKNLAAEDEINIEVFSGRCLISFLNYYYNCEYPSISLDENGFFHSEWRTLNNDNKLSIIFLKNMLIQFIFRQLIPESSMKYISGTVDIDKLGELFALDENAKEIIYGKREITSRRRSFYKILQEKHIIGKWSTYRSIIYPERK